MLLNSRLLHSLIPKVIVFILFHLIHFITFNENGFARSQNVSGFNEKEKMIKSFFNTLDVFFPVNNLHHHQKHAGRKRYHFILRVCNFLIISKEVWKELCNLGLEHCRVNTDSVQFVNFKFI